MLWPTLLKDPAFAELRAEVEVAFPPRLCR